MPVTDDEKAAKAARTPPFRARSRRSSASSARATVHADGRRGSAGALARAIPTGARCRSTSPLGHRRASPRGRNRPRCFRPGGPRVRRPMIYHVLAEGAEASAACARSSTPEQTRWTRLYAKEIGVDIDELLVLPARLRRAGRWRSPTCSSRSGRRPTSVAIDSVAALHATRRARGSDGRPDGRGAGRG